MAAFRAKAVSSAEKSVKNEVLGGTKPFAVGNPSRTTAAAEVIHFLSRAKCARLSGAAVGGAVLWPVPA